VGLGVETTNQTANAALSTNSATMNKGMYYYQQVLSKMKQAHLHLVYLQTITIRKDET